MNMWQEKTIYVCSDEPRAMSHMLIRFEMRQPVIGQRKNRPSPDRRARVKAARKAKHRNRP